MTTTRRSFLHGVGGLGAAAAGLGTAGAALAAPARRKAVRLNVSIPGYAVNLIDQAAASVGASRSGFITKATLDYIDRRVGRNG